jgi:hypothetical protein
MEEQEASGMGQQILVQLRSHEALSSWQVFRISRKKLATLIFSFCSFMGLSMGLLALYLFENPDHHPPVPPEATHALIVIMLGFVVGALLLSMTIWMTMKNKVLLLTPEALVRGDRKKPRRVFYIAYRDIAAMYVDGSSVMIQSKWEHGRKKQIDCRLFENSPQELAHHLLVAYEDFRASHAHRHSKTH